MGRFVIISAICVLLAGLAACSPSEPGVMIFVAASAADAVELVAGRFESDTGVAVSVNGAASSVLAQQISAGADADLFLSANPAWCDYLDEGGHVVERVDLLENRLVLIVPSAQVMDVASPQDLLQEAVRRIAVADTDSVPAGQYAKQALVKLGLWSEVERKLLPGGDVRQALVYVERGEAEAGIVYATDTALTDNVRVVYEFDGDASGPIVYPLMLTKAGGDSDDASRFFEFLQSRDAGTVFAEHGFRVVEK